MWQVRREQKADLVHGSAIRGDSGMGLEHRPEMELIPAGEHDDATQLGRPHVMQRLLGAVLDGE